MKPEDEVKGIYNLFPGTEAGTKTNMFYKDSSKGERRYEQ